MVFKKPYGSPCGILFVDKRSKQRLHSWYHIYMKPVKLELLTSPGCVHCHAFLEFWKTAQAEWPNVEFKEVSVTTPDGQALAGKYLIFSSPGIIINDELWATGGFDKNAFIEKLKTVSQ